MPDPTPQKLAIEVAEMREQTQTHEAETKAKVAEYQRDYSTGWQTFLDTIAKRDTEHAEKLAKLEAERAQRDTEHAQRDAERAEKLAKLEANWRADVDRRDKEAIQRESTRDKWLYSFLVSILLGLVLVLVRTPQPTPLYLAPQITQPIISTPNHQSPPTTPPPKSANPRHPTPTPLNYPP